MVSYIIQFIVFHLFYSIRILPHHQDTGGFFVTVMEKIKPLPWETTLKKTNEVETDESVNVVKNTERKRKEKKRRFQGYKEDPFVFLTDDDPVWPEIR